MFVWHMCVFGAEWWIGSRGKDSYGEANKHFGVPYVYRIFFLCAVCVVVLSFRRQFNCEHFHEFFINLSIILESKQRYGIGV